uniref:ZP domain-containing protein n=1 Tax=Romanomermis culicivorax TaxID=13658 RepID=A0A915IE13_ROMCU
MLSTDEVRDSGRMPVCTYQVRRESRTGAIVKYAKVGEPVYHTWECDGSSYKLLVKNCFVDDGQGTRYQILDDKGCVVDKYILPGIQYDNADPSKAWVEAHVFKYADRPTVYFQCAVLVCNKNEKSCDGITPPKCPGVSGFEAVSGTATSSWPANNVNRGVYNSTAEKSAPSAKSAPSVYPSQLRIFRDFTAENGGLRRRKRQIVSETSSEMETTTKNQIIKVKRQNKLHRSNKNHDRRSTTNVAEVDLISDAITVIEIDDSATLKNGKNNAMDAKITSMLTFATCDLNILT